MVSFAVSTRRITKKPTRRADIVAIADINEASANEQADRFGADAYTDYRALLDRSDIDAVDVCVHPRPHLEITRAATDAGKHILMEKTDVLQRRRGR